MRRTLAACEVECDLRVLGDGQQAFRFIEEIEADHGVPAPDMILLDVELPYHNGLEILRKLRESERCGRTPVVLMSGSESAGAAFSEAKKHAPRHFFQKRAGDEAVRELGETIKELLPAANAA